MPSPPPSRTESPRPADEIFPLALRDVIRLIARHWVIFLGTTLVALGATLGLHWAFPPWYQANVYLKLGDEWGRAVQTEQQTLEEAFAVNRSELVEQLMREGNVGPKPRPLTSEEAPHKEPPPASSNSPLVVWDLKTANLVRCELPPLDPRRAVLFGQGRTPELAVAFLENVADRIVEKHLNVASKYRERWNREANEAEQELERLETIRRGTEEAQTAGQQEQALKKTALDLLQEVEIVRQEELDDARKRLKLTANSMTSRTGTPQVLGPVGARTWPIVIAIGLLGGILTGSVLALLAELSTLWKTRF